MKRTFLTRRRGLIACGAVLLALLLPCAALSVGAEGVVPISETEVAGEAQTQPPGSTSVGLHTMPNRETAPAVSYGLRVMAAREEMVFAGLCGNEISFTAEDICRAMNLSELDYVTIRSLPAPGEGTLFVGSVGASEGQVISAGSLSLLSFAAADDTKPSEAVMTLSVNGSDYAMTCRLCLLDRLNYTPTVALAPTISLQIETYRDLPAAGTVSAYDPEGDEITYEIVRYASHGRVTLTDRHTGAYVYTPDRGYTGQDSFDYVVRDRYGNYSTSATVSITVTAPPTSVAYADIDGEENAATILKVSDRGLMNGTRVGGETYFKPAEAISRVEFLVTALQAAGITAEQVADLGDPSFADVADIPVSMRPFVSYAVQKNYVSGKAGESGLCFKPNDPITRAEASVILSNIIGYAVEDTVTAFADELALPAWSLEALTSLRALGILLCPDDNAHADKTMTRGDTAAWLCRTVQLMGG
ncbi:MAG: S-layer homology domain-containing protein [Clostridia bacterium]|nr:S-layer homology domain-containing protein [Clostridia bacterium]